MLSGHEEQTSATMRRRIGAAALFALLVVSLLVAACHKEPGALAPGLTRRAVPRITFGMSEATARELLGPPLSTYAEDRDGIESTSLLYAQSGGWKVIGMRHAVEPLGVGCSLIFESGLLAKAVIIDADREVMCNCHAGHCPENWPTLCLPGLPE